MFLRMEPCLVFLFFLIIGGVSCAPASVLSPSEYAQLEQTHAQIEKSLQSGEEPVLNIKTFGAVGDGVHNDTEALLKAMLYASVFKPWTVLIPEGTFLIYPATLPCHNIRLAIRGMVLAPPDPSDWPQSDYYWRVQDANNCTITGFTEDYEDFGVISGQGSRWWGRETKKAPVLILFDGVAQDSEAYPVAGVFNISLVNSPGTHIAFQHTRWYSSATVSGVDIYSPATSGTIGVQLVNASVRFDHNKISCGADNIQMLCGRGDMNRVFAGGDYNEFGSGDGVAVIMYDGIMGNITFYSSTWHGTRYGLRVLGAVDGTGYIQNVGVSSSTMTDVGTPLVVDNTMCPEDRHDCTSQSQGVKIDYVNAYDLTAFQTSGIAGEFRCRHDQMCSADLNDVSIKPAGVATENRFVCDNMDGYSDNVTPEPCFKHQK